MTVLATDRPESTLLEVGDLRQVDTVRDIQIFVSAVPQSKFPQVRARLTMQHTAARIHEVVSDYDRFDQFIPRIMKSKVIRRNAEYLWVHQVLRFPWPMADREFVIRVINHDSDRKGNYFWIEWHLDEEETEKLSGVKPKVMSGFWELRGDAAVNATKVTYVVNMDPGGAIPAWLVKFATRSLLPAVVEAVRDEAGSPQSSEGVQENDTSWPKRSSPEDR